MKIYSGFSMLAMTSVAVAIQRTSVSYGKTKIHNIEIFRELDRKQEKETAPDAGKNNEYEHDAILDGKAAKVLKDNKAGKAINDSKAEKYSKSSKADGALFSKAVKSKSSKKFFVSIGEKSLSQRSALQLKLSIMKCRHVFDSHFTCISFVFFSL